MKIKYTKYISDVDVMQYVDEPLELKKSSMLKILKALFDYRIKPVVKEELKSRIRLFKLANIAMEMHLRRV